MGNTVAATSNLCSESERSEKSTLQILQKSPEVTTFVSHQHNQRGEQLLQESVMSMMQLEGAANGKTEMLDAIQHSHLYGLDESSWSNLSRGLSALVRTDESFEEAHQKCNTPCETTLKTREWLTLYVAVSYSHSENNFDENLSQGITDVVHATMKAAVGAGFKYRIWSDRLLSKNRTAQTDGARIKWARIGLLPYLTFPTISVTFDREAALRRYWIATEVLCAITTGGLLFRHEDDDGSFITKGISGVQFMSLRDAHLTTKCGMASGTGELALRLLSGANKDKDITYEEDRQEVLEWAREVAFICPCERMTTLSTSLSADSRNRKLKHHEIATGLVFISMYAYKSSCSPYITESRNVLYRDQCERGWDGFGEWLSMPDIDRSEVDVDFEDQWKKGVTWIMIAGSCGKKLAVGERRKREKDNMGSAMIVKLSSNSDMSGRGRVEASLALHGSESEMILSALAQLYDTAFGMCTERCACDNCEQSRQLDMGLPSEIVSGYHVGESVSRRVSERVVRAILKVFRSVEECQDWIPQTCSELAFLSDCNISWS